MKHEALSFPLELPRPVRVEVRRGEIASESPAPRPDVLPPLPPFPLPRAIVVNASFTLGHPGVLDEPSPATWIECPTPEAADELWLQRPTGPLLAMVCDGRNWVVTRRIGTGTAPHGRLFTHASLLHEITRWLDRVHAALRLAELDRLAGTARVRLLREETVADLGHDADLWRHWLTEDDKALFRRAAGSLLEELGYLGKGGW